MPVSRALIVDDSRTAQYRLKKLLERYALDVDLTTSAEEALGYLSYRTPAVIFLDHHMEGMDGFEALKIIKANPSTATIPVIMYTSKSDDLYANQAHALGALDTLSKGVMQAKSVEDVLAKLHIYPSDKGPAEPESSEDPVNDPKALEAQALQEAQTTAALPQDEVTSSEIKAQIARLFELHIADVRTQITENTKFIVRRLTGEIKSQSAANDEANSEEEKTPLFPEEEVPENDRGVGLQHWLLGLILFGVVVLIFQQSALPGRVDARISSDEGEDSPLVASANAKASSDTNANERVPNVDYDKILRTLGWAMTVDLSFAYEEEPLHDAHVVQIQNLTQRLHDAGFRGFIDLNIRLGNYCLSVSDGGTWNLAPPDLPVTQCTLASEQPSNFAAGNYTSLAFVQFEQSAAPVQQGDVEFMVSITPYENPMFPYPDRLSSVTASEWNAVASRNQRVVVDINSAY